jgi:hypothetical protein
MLTRRLVCVLGACVALTSGCEDSTDVAGSTTYSATLTGAKENPANQTTGTGTFSASLHPTNGTLSYNVTWSGLTGPAVNGGHIHGPASATQNVGILVDFRSPPTGTTNALFANLGAGATSTSGSASGNLNLNLAINPSVTGAQFLEFLNTGQLYVNIHTAANQGGEIRGQIQKN